MLRKWWEQLFGPSKTDELMKMMIESNQQTVRSVMGVAQEMASASQKQSEVLAQYLDLFKQSEPTTTWREDPVGENMRELVGLGYPDKGTEQEKHDWFLKNLERL